MAKPKTKGAPIQIRLPIQIDEALRAGCAEGQTPAEKVVNMVVAQMIGVRGKIEGKTAPEYILIEDPIHEHKKAAVNGAGLYVCKCGAIRGVDGTWR